MNNSCVQLAPDGKKTTTTAQPLAMKANLKDTFPSATQSTFGPQWDTDLKNGMTVADEKMEMKKETKSFGKLWLEFTDNCTLHGIRYIWNGDFIFRRLLWLLLVLLCLGLMSYQIIDRIIYYYSWPVTVNVDINYNKTLIFPSVTICNQNAFRATKAAELQRYRLLEYIYNNVRYVDSSELERFGYNNITMEELFKSVAHQKEDMIISCMWGSEPCTFKNFEQIYTDHGVCYTYSQLQAGNKYRKALSTGAENGLRLILNVEQYEYMPGPNNAAGIKILMHNEDEFPKVRELGLATPTGAHAFVGLKIISLSNLPKPRGLCSTRDLKYFSMYTPENCEIDCFTTRLNERCNCRLFYMPHKNDYPPVCTLKQQQDCYLPNKAEILDLVRKTCVCPVPCKSLLFEPTVSYATTSTYAVQSLMNRILSTGVKEKFIRAREVTNRMQLKVFNRTRDLLINLENSFRPIKAFFDVDLSNRINSQIEIINNLYNTTKEQWALKQDLNKYQIYVTEKNFIRGREAMEERTLKYLGFDFISFVFRMDEQIRSLVDPEIITKNLKDMIYFLINRDCKEHLQKNMKALGNYTELYDSLTNGIPIFRYKYKKIPRSHNLHIVPRLLFNRSLTYSNYSKKYSRMVPLRINEIIEYLGEYMELANDTYQTGILNMSRLDIVSHRYGKACKNYNFAKSAFYYYCLDWALEEVKKKEVDFQMLWNDYENVAKDIMLNLNNVNSLLSSLQANIIADLDAGIKLANDYLNDTISKRRLASMLSSQKTYEGVNNLQAFFSEVRSRGTLLYDNWKKLSQASVAIWKSIFMDEDCFEYYNFANITQFQENPGDKINEIERTHEDVRNVYDFRHLIGNKDRILFHDFKKILNDMNNFEESLKIDDKFMR
ncbi:degenerin del-10 [Octopus vulgaris]|uniref:Degenerin del-10 n=1 Tax=Octopus vulgaris TaxID=6645 RepID=A0AA36FKL6_OCTVU|nr:degenerin del-10 [Octopus vulgaris]